MNAALRRRFEMAVRVRDFLRAHPTEASALARLEQLLDRAHQLAAQQHAGLLAARGSVARRAEVRRELQSKLLHYLAGVGAVGANESVELEAQFRLPQGRVSNRELATIARGMLGRAIEHKELLTRLGLSASVFGDITAALEAFEQSLETTTSGRLAHVGASSDLPAVASQVSQQVRLLEGLVRYHFGRDAELMAAWASARNVVGPSRSGETNSDAKVA